MSSSKRKSKEEGPKVTLEYAHSDVDAGIEGPFLGKGRCCFFVLFYNGCSTHTNAPNQQAMERLVLTSPVGPCSHYFSIFVFVAVFPGITPPKQAPFNVYKPDGEETKSKKKRRIIEADTGKVEFVGQNFGETSRQGFCR